MMGPAGTDTIQFNALKHHTGAISRFIISCPIPALPQRLKVLGNSQMDLYIGSLQEEVIYQEVLQFLAALQIDTAAAYQHWLEQNGHYRSITLSDHSVWILRWGQQEGRYIHLHPGRYSPGTVRVKAAVLKTAITLWVYLKNGLIHTIDDESLNRIRKEVLELPPVKGLDESQAVLRMTGILETGMSG